MRKTIMNSWIFPFMVKVDSMIVAARLAESDSDSLSLSRLTVRALAFYFKPSMLLGLEPLPVGKKAFTYEPRAVSRLLYSGLSRVEL